MYCYNNNGLHCKLHKNNKKWCKETISLHHRTLTVYCLTGSLGRLKPLDITEILTMRQVVILRIHPYASLVSSSF